MRKNPSFVASQTRKQYCTIPSRTHNGSQFTTHLVFILCESIMSSTTMRKIALAAIAILLASASVAEAAKKQQIKVSRENWPNLTLGRKVMVLFTFPWCHHCKTFKTTWAALRRKHASEDLVFLEIDCESEEGDKLCDDFGISVRVHRPTVVPRRLPPNGMRRQ